MRKLLLTLIAIMATSSFAKIKIQEELYVFTTDKAVIDSIQYNTELIVDHIGERGFELYGPKGTKKYIGELGLDFIELKHPQDEKAFADYPSHAQITQKLKELVARKPHIAKLMSIGKSVNGKELWVVKLSDNVNVDEVEPEFKYISSMHGDEITGRELLPFLIEDMIDGYGNDAAITELINNTEIYIMPSMNPDGSKRRRRYNANNVDLNRDFPDFTRGDGNTMQGREPETKAVMKFQAQRNFSLSANYHGGAVVVNYPWDSTYERHPFDHLVQQLSIEYASLNPEMRGSSRFNRGITNGADWYVLHGGMQDWSYHWHNDLQVTIEVSGSKWPNYSRIAGYYRDNKESMFAYMRKVHMGAGIKFTNKSVSGTVEIIKVENKNLEKNLGTYGFQRGEFYKVLEPGAYTFIVKANGQTTEVPVYVNNVTFGNYFTIQ